MAKSLVLGNGNILIGYDSFGQVYDLYFPYVGHENHTSGHYVHKIGIWVDEQFSWLDSGEWQIDIENIDETLASDITAKHENLGITLHFYDAVYNEKNIFIREFTFHNHLDKPREVKIYFNQQFIIYESVRGDTAFFEPKQQVVIHYKGRRNFLVNSQVNREKITGYSIGLLGIEGREGTYKDAEDGKLEQNPIEHGSVDSVIEQTLYIEPGGSQTGYYWMCIAKHYASVLDLNAYVIQKTPKYLLHSTQAYWTSWSSKQNYSFYKLSLKAQSVFKQSLLTMRAHVNSDNGTIIASGDSDLLKNGRDTYSYLWPRDGAFVANALDKAGYANVTESFFQTANELITDEGYFMHKYLADKSIGSSWHPWVWQGKPELPIQEDETALVIWALWEHYNYSRDLEFIEKIYNSLIVRAVNFMLNFRSKETGLPQPSYGLWEERFGTSTFTSASVYGALTAAAKFADKLGKQDNAKLYREAAAEIKQGILDHLYDADTGCFYKRINSDVEGGYVDKTVDISSVFGLFRFGVLDDSPEVLNQAFENTVARLWIQTDIGGICRYEDDYYFRVSTELPGNPWVLTTMWYAQFLISQATSELELQKPLQIIEWAGSYSSPAEMLPEQLHPHTGEPLSATPLTWSHGEYVNTVIDYMAKAAELGLCEICVEEAGDSNVG